MALDFGKKGVDLYAACEHIHRTVPEYEITDDIAKAIAGNYRTIPSFEKSVYEYIFKNHYSLTRNEFLKCRWLQYKLNIESRIFAPFQFPSVRDLHFNKHAIRLLPAESIFRHTDFRFKLKPGPGVDSRGQVPIPQELLMKRGLVVKEDTTEHW